MSAQYLGLCTRPGKPSQAARVRLLAQIKQGESENWLIVKNLTESGNAPVLWITSEQAPWLSSRLLLVRVTFEREPLLTDTLPDPADVVPFGSYLLDEKTSWQRPLPIPVGAHLHIRQSRSRKLVGPWQVVSTTNSRSGTEIQGFEPTLYCDEINESDVAAACMRLDYVGRNWLLLLCTVDAPPHEDKPPEISAIPIPATVETATVKTMGAMSTEANVSDVTVFEEAGIDVSVFDEVATEDFETTDSEGEIKETVQTEARYESALIPPGDDATAGTPCCELTESIPRWQEFRENCHPSCLPLLEMCCRSGLTPEEVDFEFVDAPEHGIQASAELAWPSKRIAVVRIDQNVDAQEFEKRYWHVFRAPELLSDIRPLRTLLGDNS